MVAGVTVPLRATSFLGALCRLGIQSGREKSPILPTRPLAHGPLVGVDPHEKQAREFVEP